MKVSDVKIVSTELPQTCMWVTMFGLVALVVVMGISDAVVACGLVVSDTRMKARPTYTLICTKLHTCNTFVG